MTSGAKKLTNGSFGGAGGPARPGRRHAGKHPEDRVTASAWERFVAGEEVGHEVRPEILASWLRCRDEYKVDPWREQAPNASDEQLPHALEDDVVFAELGGMAKSIEAELDERGGLVAVTDGLGRILTAWGDHRVLSRATECNLAPWSTWSEQRSGTNGMGTALESNDATLVTRWEHWCVGFHDWSCAGIAIRDPITEHPLGALDVSSYRTPLPGTVLGWLRKAVVPIEAELRRQANRSLSDLLAVFVAHERTGHGLLVAADNGGRLVAANEEGRRLFGLPTSAFGTPSAFRGLERELPELKELILQAVERAHADRFWAGSAEVRLPSVGAELDVTFRPAISEDRVVGILISSVGPEGERLATKISPMASGPSRIVAVRAQRLILLSADDIRFAEAEGNIVWLDTEQGRLRAVTRGLGALEERLRGQGFLRVHRRFLVNLGQVKEIAPSFKDGFWLVMGTARGELVPVSRRRAAEVRAMLGL